MEVRLAKHKIILAHVKALFNLMASYCYDIERQMTAGVCLKIVVD